MLYMIMYSIIMYSIPIFGPKNNAKEVPRWFSYRWVPELLPPPKIIRMFGPKTAIFAPIYAFSDTYRPWPFGALLVGWRAGCISQDTSLLYYPYKI